MADAVKTYGWEAKPRDPSVILGGKKNIKDPMPQTVASIKLPDSTLAASVLQYAATELSTPTFNHSMRVFYYGMTASIRFATILTIQRQGRRSTTSSSPNGTSLKRHTY